MTDAETAAHLRKYVEAKRSMPFSWPTDACGYDQHIRFVEHRNKNWTTAVLGGQKFEEFILAYADALDPPASPPESPDGSTRRMTDEQADVADCTCHFECREDSHSGQWHQHEDDPCPRHPGAPVVG